MSDDWDVVYSYTRSQAIEDGYLIELDEKLCEEAGIKIPVTMTSTLYDKYIKSYIPGQDITGRLWDTLFMFRLFASQCESSSLFFEVAFQMTETKSELVKLKAVIGPGDNPSPTLILMLHDED